MGVFSPPRVGVIEIRGVIAGGERTTAFEGLLRRLVDNRSVRAILVDIDSPGGSATASDAFRLAIARARERKPVVAYVHGLGASGGYMAALAATRILALPTALVGSIGVISVRPHLKDLLARGGITLSVTKAGRLKDLGAFWREETPEEQAHEQALVDEYYAHFIETVAAARRLPPDRVQDLATGEVFTGRRALDMGLVDDLGDWEDAVRAAMNLGQLTKPRLTYARARRGLAERFLGRLPLQSGALGTLLGARVLYLDPRSLPELL